MRKTRTGSKLALLFLVLAGIGSAKDKKPAPSYALVAGTVFHDNGMSFPGAQVKLEAQGDSPAARKFKKIEVVASPRGEFAIRVPAGAMQYLVTASAPGFQPQSKPAAISGEERVDVFFQLEPASKK